MAYLNLAENLITKLALTQKFETDAAAF